MKGGGLLHPQREMLLMPPLPSPHPRAGTPGKRNVSQGLIPLRSKTHTLFSRFPCFHKPLLRSGLSFEMLPRSISRNEQALR